MIIPLSVNETDDKSLIEYLKKKKNRSSFIKNLIYISMYKDGEITEDFLFGKILSEDISNLVSGISINLFNLNSTPTFEGSGAFKNDNRLDKDIESREEELDSDESNDELYISPEDESMFAGMLDSFG